MTRGKKEQLEGTAVAKSEASIYRLKVAKVWVQGSAKFFSPAPCAADSQQKVKVLPYNRRFQDSQAKSSR